MKLAHAIYLALGLFVGILIGSTSPAIQKSFAQTPSKDALTEEELDKKLTEILESQDKIKKRLEAITAQTQFLKASSGK